MTEHHQSDPSGAIDVHQHLWPDELVDRLRARSRRRTCAAGRCTPTANRRTTWTRQAMTSRPASRRTRRRGWSRPASASPPRSGIEGLRRPEAQPLIDAWHRGVRELPDHFRAWASVPERGPRRRRR